MPISLSIHSHIRDYEVLIEETPDFTDTLAKHPQACFVVDENVWKIYSKNLLKNIPPNQIIVLSINEDRKNLDTVQELYNQLLELPTKRNLTLISFGGGILQDITGFTASTIYRGINWIYIPTTLLSQADSCIGSKTSLNYRKYKNMIGTFFPPASIHIYPPFLQSQLKPDFLSGFGEVIKLHIMGGYDSYRQLVELSASIMNRESESLLKAIHQSLVVKLDYMTGDEFDTGRRNLLNFGHDFGHALESTSSFIIPHGQAVIFGMLAANAISCQRGLLTQKLECEIAEDLLLPNLVTRPSADMIDTYVMVDAMKQDKKRIGEQLALIMMTENFEFMRINDLSSEEVAGSLNIISKRLG